VSHSHAHHDEEVNAYYLDQLFTIGVCGLLGGVAIMLWWPTVAPDGTTTNRLRWILADKFHPWVLGGGVVLLLLVVIRAWTLWVSVGEENRARAKGDSHDHDHCHEHAATCCGHDHDHEHEHAIAPAPPTEIQTGSSHLPVLTQPGSPAVAEHGHSHSHSNGGEDDHGHEHGWAPWRYVVLLLPVVLFFLDLPNAALSMPSDNIASDVDATDVKGTDGDKKVYSNIGFTQLEAAAMFPEARDHYSGKYVRLTGQFNGSDDRQFTLSRYKLNCCVADAVPLRAVIVVDYSQLKDQKYQPLEPNKLQKQWVSVTGQVQFLKKKGTNEYMTALIVTPTPEKPLMELVEVLERPPANPYLN
jgi:hypothetical protein